MSHNHLRHTNFGILGGLLGFLGVALGAFGAHGLEGVLTPGDMAIFETAARYQMLHALALVAVALLPARSSRGAAALAGWSFAAGIGFFSGSLYLMVLTGARWLGAVTPLGGVAFLVGWGALTWCFFQRSREEAIHGG